jgi:diguanylate cyclase (GGDEF)-like protein
MSSKHMPSRASTSAWHWLRARAARGWRVPPACVAAHDALVRARLRVLAPVLVVLTLAWIPVEALWLGAATLGQLALPRSVLAAALAALALAAPRMAAATAVHAFLWIQALGFGWLQWQVLPERAEAMVVGYGLFPFVLSAQLSLLPLPWSRGLLAILAPAALLALLLLRGGGNTGWNAPLLFLLIAAMAVWSSHAQLRLLVDLLGARSDAAHDPLTGLANRRLAMERLAAERGNALRNGEPLSVLMLDLDHFKRINDRWGHAVGDRVLVAVADVLHDELRGIDLAARHGGEEFLCILPGTGGAAARQVAGRIRARIANLRIAQPEADVAATVSIGVATLSFTESVDQLVQRADAAMYAAKAAGRNRCAIAPRPGDLATA